MFQVSVLFVVLLLFDPPQIFVKEYFFILAFWKRLIQVLWDTTVISGIFWRVLVIF